MIEEIMEIALIPFLLLSKISMKCYAKPIPVPYLCTM
jgi:hypothetical protein